MLKKLFWVGVGVGIGALAFKKLGEVRDAASQDGLNRAVGRASDAVAETLAAFRDGMAGREAELYEALGLADAGEASRQRPRP
ncbi:hypothetical protein ACQ3I4_03060 [Zafaria sp. Z1313]|uniref:hypothetical protein n=1 Tax=unclassified Zafaria TaxID=2828765 RepID=UPI002E795F55|nr:hypothetical protein [Zafaria sp. J156]MEE1621116.1 hypothetical protein [Zafaria sp. J156]